MTDPEILEKEYQEALKCKVEGKILEIKKSKLNDCNNSLEIYIKGTKSYYKIIGTENSDYSGKKLCLIYTDFPIYNEDNIEYYPKRGDFFQGVAEQSELKSNKLLKYGKKAFNNSTDDFCNGVKIDSISQTSNSTGVTIENTSNSGKVLEKPVEIFSSSKNYNELNKCKIHGKIINIQKENYDDCYFNLIIKLDNNFSFKATEYLEDGCITDVNFPIYLENGNEYYPKKGDDLYGVINVFNNKLLKYGKKAFDNSTDDFCNGVKIDSISQTSNSTGVTIENTSNYGKILEKPKDDLVNNLNNNNNQENIKSAPLDNTIIKKPDVEIESNIVKNENLINTGTILDVFSNIKDESKDNFVNNQNLTIESKNEVTQTGIITNKENYLEKPVLIKQNNFDYHSQSYFIFGGIIIVIFTILLIYFLKKYFKSKQKN